MPLQPQEIRVPFGGGVDQKTDKKQVIPGKLLELINGEFTTIKQITKRNGFLTPYSDQTVDGDTIGEGSAIYRRGKELLITDLQTNSDTGRISWEDGGLMHTHGPDEDEWKTIGTREPLSLEVDTIQRPITQNRTPDVALADSEKYVCYAWVEEADPAGTFVNYYAHASVIELANNATIIDDWAFNEGLTAGKDAGGVHVVGIDETNPIFYVWIPIPVDNDIYLAQINCTTLSAAGAPVLKIDDLHGDMIWDVCTAHHDDHGVCSVVAYKELANGLLCVKWFDEDGVEQETYTGPLATVIDNALTVFEVWDDRFSVYKVMTAYQEAVSDSILHTAFNSDSTLYGNADNIIHFASLGDARNITGCKDSAADHYTWHANAFIRLYVEFVDTGITNVPTRSRVEQFQCRIIGTAPLQLNTMWRSSLGSKAWEYGSKSRVWVAHDSWGLEDAHGGGTADDVYTVPAQNTYFLRSTDGHGTDLGGGSQDEHDRTDARCLYGSGGGESFGQSLSAVVSPATNEYTFAALRQDVVISAAPNEVSPTLNSVVGIKTIFAETAQPSTELGPTIQTGGGYIGEADGRFYENNFHLYPGWMKYALTVNGASAIAAHWQYIAVYEWTDREGQRHQSQPSQPMRVPSTGTTTNDDDHVTLTVATLPFGDYDRLAETRIVIYRTTNLELGGDLIFYRLPETMHRFNRQDQDIALFYDGPGGGGTGPVYVDSVITERERLYTTGDVLGNICPPASSIMNVFGNRVVLVPDEDPTNLWFSKLKRQGVAVSFVEEFKKRISDGGATTALIAMDNREIVFKPSEIRAFSGPGPNDLGQGTFGDDYLITTDVGCVDRGSAVMTDKGIMFKSAKGIYLLGRNLQVSYIGAPVEDYNEYKVVKSTLVENKNQVRFLLEDFMILVYDYLVGQWSVFQPPQIGEIITPWYAVDSAIWQDNHVMIHSFGTVYQESDDYEDLVDSFIPLDLTSSWVKLNGLQGYQRVWWISLLGEVYGTCTINYEVYYDYIETNPQTGSVTIDAAFAADPPAQFKIKPRFGNGRCQAFKIRLYDAALAVPAGTQKGYAISDFMIEIGKLKGVMRVGGLKTK